jgi:hypothetical protein
MEPTNLNPSAGPDAEIEALLRGGHAALTDNGFSARVVAALPAKARAHHTRLRWCAAGTITGVLVALASGASFTDFEKSVLELEANLAALVPMVADPSFAIALGVAVVSLGFAFWPAGRKALGL